MNPARESGWSPTRFRGWIGNLSPFDIDVGHPEAGLFLEAGFGGWVAFPSVVMPERTRCRQKDQRIETEPEMAIRKSMRPSAALPRDVYAGKWAKRPLRFYIEGSAHLSRP
jgi:hypothetical protein